MDITVKLDFEDEHSRALIIGSHLQCNECDMAIINMNSAPKFAEIILALAKHRHGMQ